MTLTKTQVVSVKHTDCDVYIGRAMPGWPASDFANKFRIGKDGNRREVLEKYRADTAARLAASPKLQASLEAMRGRRIGCWCKPPPGQPCLPHHECHGDILVELLGETPEKPALDLQISLFG